MRWLLIALGSLSAVVLVTASQQRVKPTSPLTIETILRVPRVHEYDLAPDGQRVAAAVSVLGLEKIWVISDPEKTACRSRTGRAATASPIGPRTERKSPSLPTAPEAGMSSWPLPGTTERVRSRVGVTAMIAGHAGPPTDSESHSCRAPRVAARAGTSG